MKGTLKLIKTFTCVLLGITFITYSVSHTFANTTIYGLKLKNRFELKLENSYPKLFRDFNTYSKNENKIIIQPIARAINNFIKDSASCVSPSNIGSLDIFYPDLSKTHSVIESIGIENVKMKIFSRSGEKAPSSISQLQNKKIVSWIGTDPKLIITDIPFDQIEVTSPKQALSLLYSKRIDYLIGFIPDTLLEAKTSNFPIPNHDSNLNLINSKTRLVCHNTKKNQELISKFNEFISTLKLEKKLKAYFSEFSVID
jgi:hypothetical protein